MRTKCGCSGVRRKPLPVEVFEQTWKLFGEAPEWKPRRLAFGKDVVVRGGGSEWKMSMRVEMDEREIEAVVYLFEEKRVASSKMTPAKRLALYTFLEGMTKRMEGLGYEGSIEDQFGTISNWFRKPLADVDAVRREIRALDRLRLGKT